MGLDVSTAGAFVAGLLSFASPCVLPLVPPFLAFMAGLSIEELAVDDRRAAAARVLPPALAFVAGFSTVFVALGATASVVGKTVTQHMQLLSMLAGGLIVLMGLHFLGILRIPLLYRTAKVEVGRRPAGLGGAYVIGLAFAFGWSPCVGPVLTAILLMAGAEESVGQGAGLLSVYAAGIGVPFLISALFADRFMRFSARLRSRMGLVEKIMGLLLVITGGLFLSGQMAAISYWLLDTFPVLGRVG